MYKPTGEVQQWITLIVHFPDGSSQAADLDYPFVYPGRAQDPFYAENANVRALFQFPPKNLAANEPPLVKYVMGYTSPGGFTLLRDCTVPSH